MRKFIFGLIATAMLAQLPVPSQAGNTFEEAKVDLRNKSDQCVSYDVPGTRERGFIESGGYAYVYVRSLLTSNWKITAKIVNCSTRALIIERYDYFPASGRSELSVHNQGSTYIMRHGP
ncbi:MAG: hypothetical protein WBD74_01315 [Candidatus Aquilonibacter sp.]